MMRTLLSEKPIAVVGKNFSIEIAIEDERTVVRKCEVIKLSDAADIRIQLDETYALCCADAIDIRNIWETKLRGYSLN